MLSQIKSYMYIVHAPDKEHVTKNKVKLIPDLSTSEVQLIIHRKTQICHF